MFKKFQTCTHVSELDLTAQIFQLIFGEIKATHYTHI